MSCCETFIIVDSVPMPPSVHLTPKYSRISEDFEMVRDLLETIRRAIITFWTVHLFMSNYVLSAVVIIWHKLQQWLNNYPKRAKHYLTHQLRVEWYSSESSPSVLQPNIYIRSQDFVLHTRYFHYDTIFCEHHRGIIFMNSHQLHVCTTIAILYFRCT